MKAPALEDIRWAVRKHRFTVGIAVGVLLVAVGVLLIRGGDGDDSKRAVVPGTGSGDLLHVLRAAIPIPDGIIPPPPPSVGGPHYPTARIRPGAKIELRDSPGGSVVATLDDETEFGSPRTFWIEEIQGDWFGVPTPELPNGELGWIRDDRTELELFDTRFWVTADVSAGRLELRYGNQVLTGFPVTVGSPGSPTPLGDYAVTDGLAGTGLGPYYGCCVLALTGHQPNLPANWIGGDRIAIHGTPGAVGGATSSGCLRASDPDMVSLFARVPLGTPVFIRA